ncbi:FCD domain-containing protein [Streptomyces arenae]|nr:FCD domain-containing protein [Streptomyces arenae]
MERVVVGQPQPEHHREPHEHPRDGGPGRETPPEQGEQHDAGLHAFSEADALFHRAIAEASRNSLLGLCARAVHEAVVEIIEKKISGVPDPTPWMRRSIAHHREVLAAIEAGDSAAAARLARVALHAYYAEHVEPETQELLSAAVADD